MRKQIKLIEVMRFMPNKPSRARTTGSHVDNWFDALETIYRLIQTAYQSARPSRFFDSK